MDKKIDKYRAPALDKGLDILELLAQAPSGISQSEIAKGLGRGANEIYRMLDRLVHRGYVIRSADGDHYILSLKLLILANIHPPRRKLLDIAEPMMRRLAIETEQSCHLAIWEDGNIVISSTFSAPGNWRLSLRSGAVIGLYNTGSGLVLIAFQNKEQRHKMLQEHQLVKGENIVPTLEFEQLLSKICRQGYSTEPSQTLQAATNLSFPILDPFGHAIACLTCPFVQRIDDYQALGFDAVISKYYTASKEIGQQLNGTI